MEKALPAAPLKPLLGLGLAVLVLHLLLLQAASRRLGADIAPLPRPLITRTLAPAAVPAIKPPPPAVRRRPPRHPPATAPTAPPASVQAPPPAPTDADSSPTLASSSVPDGDPHAAAPSDTPPPADSPAAAEPAPPPPYAVPGSVRLTYSVTGTVRRLNYTASAELLWRQDGSNYDARLEVGAFLLGSRVQTSRGQITAEGLAPTRFSDKVRSEVAAHFVRDKGKIIFSANTPEALLQAGAQDQLSVFVQLAGLIAGDPARYPPGTAFELQAVGAREAALWRFIVDGPELLQLPGGKQATLKLTRPPQQSYDLKVELWLAPALDYLPARIRLTQDNGDFIDQQWRASDTP